MTKVQSEYALVAAHHRQWIEPRNLAYFPQQSQLASESESGGGRETKNPQPAGRSQGLVALFPVAPAQRIYNQLDASTPGQVQQHRKPVAGPVVDRMVQASFVQKSVFGYAGGPICRRADMLC